MVELSVRLPRGGCPSALCASRDSRTIQRDGRDAGNEVAQTERGGFRSSSLGDKLPRSVFRLRRASRPLRGLSPAGRGGRRLSATAAWASPERLNFWYNTRQREQRKVIRYVDPMLQAARQEDRGTQRRRSRCGRRRRRGSFKENEARRKEARRDVRQPKRRGKKRGAASAAPLFLPRSGGWLTSRRAS